LDLIIGTGLIVASQANIKTESISLGYQAGQNGQFTRTIAMGYQAGQATQGGNAIAIGYQAGRTNQQGNAIAIGSGAGQYSQGSGSIAIGNNAGFTGQASNSVVINASGNQLNGANSGFYAAPIRNADPLPGNILYYDSTNYEIVYGAAPTTSMTITDNSTNASAWYPTFVSGTGSTSTFYTNTGALTYTPSTGQLNSTTFNATSDYRIKENVTNLDASFSVDNLRPVTYFNKNAGKQDIGFIAHEIQEIFPYLVTGEKDGDKMQSLNYLGLIGVLTKEIKDLKKRVSILENKPAV
jgi:hypothetical protein